MLQKSTDYPTKPVKMGDSLGENLTKFTFRAHMWNKMMNNIISLKGISENLELEPFKGIFKINRGTKFSGFFPEIHRKYNTKLCMPLTLF